MSHDFNKEIAQPL